jgi:hypothetical protein
MSRLLAFFLILGLAGMALAADTGNRSNTHKVPLPFDPNQADGREGGETIATAVAIPSLPYSDSGVTCDNVNDYDEACPYTGSTAPDVVYSYTPATSDDVIVDLCYSSYDTKVFVYQDVATPGAPYACNDDFYFGAPCFVYSSKVQFTANVGHTYYIVVDGYFGACGTYQMDVTGPPPPLECPDYGLPENEPPLVDYYIDNWNGGCNSTPNVFQPIHWIDDLTGCGWLCGVSGWYYNFGSYRDTDWFPVTAAGFEMTYTVCAEQVCNIYVLNTDCAAIVVLYSATTGSDGCATITWPTNPGEDYILWCGPSAFSGPVNEFLYNLEVCGHIYDIIPVEPSTWGAVKDMYR